MNTDGLTVTRLEAVNVLKFDRFELDSPGKLTLFRGANNQGKTTALRLLGLAVRGAEGESSKVIHDGASKGVVSLGLSNGYVMRRSFTEKGEYFDLFDEQGHKVPSPQSYVNKWLGEYRDFNPLAWLSMPDKEQVRVLLQAIDVRLTPAEFTKLTGLDAPKPIDFNAHGLLVLEALRSHYADERRDKNREATQKQNAALEAKGNLPATKPIITDERRAEASRAVAEAQQLKSQFEARELAATSHTAAVARIDEAIRREQSEHERLNGEIKQKLDEIERINVAIGGLRDRQRECTARAEELHQEKNGLASSAPPTDAEKVAANETIRAARALRDSITADEQILSRFAAVEVLEQDANDAKANAAILDSTIRVLDIDVRASLMAKAALPVEALTIEEGRILVGGHELQYLAESQRIRIAVAIARALRPKLRVIVLDGTEAIDIPTFEIFLQEIRGDGFSYLATQVDPNGGPLQVIQFGENTDGVFPIAANEQAVA